MVDGSVRAQWHIADPAADEDPFQRAAPASGVSLDLTMPVEQLRQNLHELLRTEANFDYMGLTCSLKDAGQDCRTCLASHARSKPMVALCDLGAEQERVLERLGACAADRFGLERELASSVAECLDLGFMDAGLVVLEAHAR